MFSLLCLELRLAIAVTVSWRPYCFVCRSCTGLSIPKARNLVLRIIDDNHQGNTIKALTNALHIHRGPITRARAKKM